MGSQSFSRIIWFWNDATTVFSLLEINCLQSGHLEAFWNGRQLQNDLLSVAAWS